MYHLRRTAAVVVSAGQASSSPESDEVAAAALVVAAALVGYLLHEVLQRRSLAGEVARRSREEKRARTLALHDPLTGLLNRRGLAELAQDKDACKNCTLLLCDLDGFKVVNDTLGHPVGDALLRNVAGRLRSALGPHDVVARLGGDEFAILQGPAAGPGAAEALARRVVDLVGRSYMVEGHLVSIGASVMLSRTHLWGNRLKCWKTMPIFLRMRCRWRSSAGTRSALFFI